jgi:uncharacterized SAM-binding protein YcdF (DUF218 family)
LQIKSTPTTIPAAAPIAYSGRPSRKLWGILRRKESWGLSWRGWLLLALVVAVTACFVALNIHPFLAVTDRTNADVLVVEGWIQRYAMQKAVEEYKSGRYKRIFTTGGPENGSVGYVNDFQTSASVGAEILTKKFGIPGDVVQMVPSHVIGRDRTYSSAIALRDWLRQHNLQVQSINIVTEGTHARRTRLLFQKALGANVVVGVIAVPSPDFDAGHWWRYSEGVEEVVTEGVGYLYAKFFFKPSQIDG